MTSCDCCVRLLLDYAAAGNQVIELKRRDAPSGLLARAMAKQAQARRRLTQYHRNHRCDVYCPNNCRGPSRASASDARFWQVNHECHEFSSTFPALRFS
jgi:hypothetical protein